MRIFQAALIIGIATSGTPSFAQSDPFKEACTDALYTRYNKIEMHYGIKKEQSIMGPPQLSEMFNTLPRRRVFSASFNVERTVNGRNDGGDVVSVFCISTEDGKGLEGIERNLPSP